MTVQQLRKELKELKEEAANKPNLWMFFKSKEEELKAREKMKKELGELEEKIQRYRDMGIFENNNLKRDFDINYVDNLSSDLVQRWKNRNNLTLDEKIQLHRDIGIFTGV
jgi:hypothetical protein